MAANPTYFDGDLRQALIDATIEAMAEGSFTRVSLRDVARRTGVSHAAPAHHFGDKAGLFGAVATEGFGLLADALRAANDHPGLDPTDRLVAVCAAYIDFSRSHPQHFEVMFQPDLLADPSRDLQLASARAYEELRRGVTAGAPELSNEDRDDLATAIWSLVHGMATLRHTGFVRDDDGLEAQRIVRAIAPALR
jgi:AcrR family transcriptional regulator